VLRKWGERGSERAMFATSEDGADRSGGVLEVGYYSFLHGNARKTLNHPVASHLVGLLPSLIILVNAKK